MRVQFDVFTQGQKVMGFNLEYPNPIFTPEYMMEVSALSRSFAEFVRNKTGTAKHNEEQFRVAFSYDAEQPFTLPQELVPCFKNDAVQDELKFSEMNEFVDAGIRLLADLQQGAHREIKSGQRK